MMPSCSSPTRTRTSLSCALALALASGCASSTGDEHNPSPGQPGNHVVKDECTSEPACDGAAVDKEGNAAVCVHVVEAWVETEDGEPAEGFRAQVCGANLCNTAASDASGLTRFSLCKNMVHPAFELPGRAKFVSYAIPITSAVSSLGRYRLVPLGAPGQQMQSSGAGERTYASGGALIRIPNGVQVSVNDLENPEPDEQRFRAARLDPDAAPGLVESSPGLELFYGLAPADTSLSGRARLTIPNSEGWEPGTSIELYEQGLDANGSPAPDAQWGRSGTGKVSDDGATLTFDDGIRQLGLVGMKRM